MPEDPTPLDPVEIARAGFEAFARGDFDGAVGFFTPNAVWEMVGGETFEGTQAIRGFMEDFCGHFERFGVDVEEIRAFSDVVLFVVNTMWGRPLNSTVEVRQRGGFVYEIEDRLAVRCTAYSNVDEARAAAERLAEERE